MRRPAGRRLRVFRNKVDFSKMSQAPVLTFRRLASDRFFSNPKGHYAPSPAKGVTS